MWLACLYLKRNSLCLKLVAHCHQIKLKDKKELFFTEACSVGFHLVWLEFPGFPDTAWRTPLLDPLPFLCEGLDPL